MVLKPETIIARVQELDTVVEELSVYKEITYEEVKSSLSKRWIIERGLIAGANLIFDIADHILASNFHIYPETYEDSLDCLYDKGVITEALYENIKGLGGFRNILVHEYLVIDIHEVHRNLQKSLTIFKEFGKQILIYILPNE